jgi:hypothetical protein
MGEWLRDLAPWSLFATRLSFDPLVMAGTPEELIAKGRQLMAVPAVSRWAAMRRFGYFLDHAGRAVGRPTVGVIALEPHQSGQPHGHGLLSIEGGVVGTEIASLHALWKGYPGNGWMRLEEPRSPADVAGYCAKYMAKDVSELVFSSALGVSSTARPSRPPGARAGASRGGMRRSGAIA